MAKKVAYIFPIAHRHPQWQHISSDQWNDWHWQLSNRLTKIEHLQQLMGRFLSEEELAAYQNTSSQFMMSLTPYYASLMNMSNPQDPIRVQAIPQPGETLVLQDELSDPLGEESHMPVPGLTHRYPDRVLLYCTHNCPVYCRHCTRKRKVSHPSTSASTLQIEQGIAYIREHPEIRDVVISGGDPLSLSDERLFALLKNLQDIPHMQMMRLGTRNPVTLPQRITKEFATHLKKLNSRRFEKGLLKPIFISTHFNHPNEVTDEAAEACFRLANAGSPLGNQMVLLRGVNDNITTVRELYKLLIRMRVKPYYLYLCDPVPGTGHFRTSVETGLEIIDGLRGHTSGYLTPQLAIDAPGAGGKILIPNGIVGRHVTPHYTIWKLINSQQEIFYYAAPSDHSKYYERSRKPEPASFALHEIKNTHLKSIILNQVEIK